MLTQYINYTQQLLQNPAAPTSLYATSLITGYINTARGQVAGESQAIRRIGTISTVVGQRNYNFSSIMLSDNSVSGVIHVRRILYAVGSGYKWMRPRNWEWFDLYKLNNPVPVSGPPQVWAQYGQGSAGTGAITGVGGGSISSGSFYIDPPPDLVYTLNLDCVCYPASLAADTDPEALPYVWTDAVPFFAAYYALLSAQTSARMQEGEKYYGYYKEFIARARTAATPDVNSYLYQQTPDVTLPNKLGQSSRRGAA